MIRIFPFQALYVSPGLVGSQLLHFGKKVFVERVVFEPCCRPPFDLPCAHLRLESAQLVADEPIRLLEKHHNASLSLRDGHVFFPRRVATRIEFSILNLSGQRGRFLGGFVEALEVDDLVEQARMQAKAAMRREDGT